MKQNVYPQFVSLVRQTAWITAMFILEVGSVIAKHVEPPTVASMLTRLVGTSNGNISQMLAIHLPGLREAWEYRKSEHTTDDQQEYSTGTSRGRERRRSQEQRRCRSGSRNR